MKRIAGYIFILFMLYSCGAKRLGEGFEPIPPDAPTDYVFSLDNFTIVGDVQPFNTELRVDTLETGLYLVYLNLYTDFPSGLPRFKFQFKYPRKYVDFLWSSRTWSNQSFVNLPNYARLQSDENLISGFSRNSVNRLTITSNDFFRGRFTGIDVTVNNDSLVFEFNFFSKTTPDVELSEYNAQILVDIRDQHFSNTVRTTAQWLLDKDENKVITKVDFDMQPVYSLWYPMHRNIPLGNITHYFDSIASMGFRSVLFDDGWQNVVRFDVNNDGTWDPSETTEVSNFMNKVRDNKMKVALWYSQPLVGSHVYVFNRFEGRFLQYRTSSQPSLDIRYPEVRDYLVKMYSDVVKSWGVDGIWFNYLNGYYPDEQVIVTADKGRDYISVRKALDSLRTRFETELLAVNPELEISQSYPAVGPLISSNTKSISGFLGTAALNQVREKMVNNRLMYGEYSPFMEVMGIHPNDKPSEIARKFHSIMFAVPYISYFSYTLPEETRETLSFWLRYWRSNISYLSEAEFKAYDPIARYPVIQSGDCTKQIIVIYEKYSPFNLGEFEFEMADIINSTELPSVMIMGQPLNRVDYIIYDHKGAFIDKGSLKFKREIATLNIPSGGLARLIVK